MNIRLANKWDQPQVIEMLRHFRQETPIEMMSECDNEQHISMLFHTALIGGGLAYVAEDKGRLIGMIIGFIEQNTWDPNIYVLRELVYWVEPEYRGGTAGYRLLMEYNRAAKLLQKEKRINMYTMSKMVNSPDLDYGRFGYRKIEETWVGGI